MAEVWHCPRRSLGVEELRWLRAHVHWAQGRYWHGPTLRDWPPRDLRAMEILDDCLAEHREREAEGRALAERLNRGG